MKNYSQKDGKWKSLNLGKTNLTIETSGCFVVSLAMLDKRTPDIVLDILMRNNAFNENGLLLSDIAAKALGFSYRGKTSLSQLGPCIAETDHYKDEGIPQHFFVWLGDGMIIDPLDGETKKNPYNIVTYRLFKKKPARQLDVAQPPAEAVKQPTVAAKKPVTAETLEKSFTFWGHIKLIWERIWLKVYHQFLEKRGWK